MRTTFAVGKLTRSTAEMVVVEPKRAPLAGPWLLRALVRAARPRRVANATVH